MGGIGPVFHKGLILQKLGTKYAAIYEMARSLEERDMPLLRRQLERYGRRQFLIQHIGAEALLPGMHIDSAFRNTCHLHG